jgi:tRNA(fMet)-specific endonuclease VapC
LILADTDVLIDYLAGVQPIAGEIASYIESGLLFTSAINCFELLSGAREGKRGDPVRHFVRSIPVLAIDRQAAVEAAKVRRQLAGLGLTIPAADSLIAGTAIVNDLPLLTRNRKHFQRIANLRLV